MKNLFFIVLVITISGLSATIINIPQDQPTIQEGINVAVNSDTVLVQPGDYQEMINYNGKNITVASLFLTTQDTTYISQTVINPSQSCYVVTFENGEDSTSVICGITITNSNAFSKGIVCINSSPKLISNIITGISGNCNLYDGSGISLINSNASIINNVISNNHLMVFESQMEGGGAGIYTFSSSPKIINNIIKNNSINAENWEEGGATGYGAGIYCNSSNPSIKNNTIFDNSMEGGSIFGAGINIHFCDSFVISNNTIYNNYSNVGGGIYIDYSIGEVSCNLITNNYTHPYGMAGGLCVRSENVTIYNNLICNNSSGTGGGIESKTNLIINNTICNNFAAEQGGGFYGHGTNPIFYNNIFYGNESIEGCQLAITDGYHTSNPEFYYNNIEFGQYTMYGEGVFDWIYENNIDDMPGFIDPTDGVGNQYDALQSDWYLTPSSPCIDTGTGSIPMFSIPLWDIQGTNRIWDGNEDGFAIIDMGAYEYGSPPFVNIDNESNVPSPKITLKQNFPNPFNPRTTISFSIQSDSKIELVIFNVKGQKIQTLAHNEYSKGLHSIVWNGDDEEGKAVSSGVYLYKLNVNDKTEAVNKCLLLK